MQESLSVYIIFYMVFLLIYLSMYLDQETANGPFRSPGQATTCYYLVFGPNCHLFLPDYKPLKGIEVSLIQ